MSTNLYYVKHKLNYQSSEYHEVHTDCDIYTTESHSDQVILLCSLRKWILDYKYNYLFDDPNVDESSNNLKLFIQSTRLFKFLFPLSNQIFNDDLLLKINNTIKRFNTNTTFTKILKCNSYYDIMRNIHNTKEDYIAFTINKNQRGLLTLLNYELIIIHSNSDLIFLKKDLLVDYNDYLSKADYLLFI